MPISPNRQLTAQRVELTVRCDQSRPGAQVQRGQEAQHQLVCVLAERDVRVRLAEQRAETVPHPVGDGERPAPLGTDALGRVQERVDLPLERHIRPRLVRMPGEQHPLVDPEPAVVTRQIVHSSLRTAQRSGKTGVEMVPRR
jgi:hypothetical protein